jgi:hypothetical protein
LHAKILGGFFGAFLTAYFIVVRQRPGLHAIGMRTTSKSLWGQSPIRNNGVAMQIGIDCVHISILLAYWLLRLKIEGSLKV